jgi:hypothetical protein
MTSGSLLASATVLPCPDGRHRGKQTGPAHDRGENEVGGQLAGERGEAGLPAQDLGVRARQQPRHRVHRVGIGEGEGARAMLQAEIRHQLRVRAPRGEALDAKFAGELIHELQRAAAHRAGGAQEDQPLHAGRPTCTA